MKPTEEELLNLVVSLKTQFDVIDLRGGTDSLMVKVQCDCDPTDHMTELTDFMADYCQKRSIHFGIEGMYIDKKDTYTYGATVIFLEE